MFVIESALRFPQCAGMAIVTHDQIRSALLAALEKRCFTGKQIADFLGVGASRITEIKKGTRRIQQHEMDVLAEFLGLGEAEQENADPSNVVMVPVIGIAAAGSWQEAVELPVYHIPRLRVKGENQAFAVEIYGDSMDRVMPHGCWAIIDPDQRDLYPGRVYLIMNGGGEGTVKRYQESPARFAPDSHNPVHQPIVIGDHPITVVGRVVAYGSSAGL